MGAAVVVEVAATVDNFVVAAAVATVAAAVENFVDNRQKLEATELHRQFAAAFFCAPLLLSYSEFVVAVAAAETPRFHAVGLLLAYA